MLSCLGLDPREKGGASPQSLGRTPAVRAWRPGLRLGELRVTCSDTWFSLHPLSHLPQVTHTINKCTQGCREDQVSFRATKQGGGGQKQTDGRKRRIISIE